MQLHHHGEADLLSLFVVTESQTLSFNLQSGAKVGAHVGGGGGQGGGGCPSSKLGVHVWGGGEGAVLQSAVGGMGVRMCCGRGGGRFCPPCGKVCACVT